MQSLFCCKERVIKNVHISGQLKIKGGNVAVGAEGFGDYCDRNADFHIGAYADGNNDSACGYGRLCGIVDTA